MPAAFISRVSNAKVFAEAGVCPLSDKLTQKQLQLFGKVALSPAGSPLRRDTFVDGSLIPHIGCYVRRRGRPRQDWTSSVLNQGRRLFGHSRLNELLTDTSVKMEPKMQGFMIFPFVSDDNFPFVSCCIFIT